MSAEDSYSPCHCAAGILTEFNNYSKKAGNWINIATNGITINIRFILSLFQIVH